MKITRPIGYTSLGFTSRIKSSNAFECYVYSESFHNDNGFMSPAYRCNACYSQQFISRFSMNWHRESCSLFK